ncbi:MAG: hypothetical protein IM631_13050 [Cytophagales bacterium]|jgi:hypothetical protein|nr:hypothetical protein [Cytophagales bacterium]MCA6372300.1 hypothetical protein [Cytophagales bacterium]MCA6382446.1 hypothetical protein [Cytophagales bacterium]
MEGKHLFASRELTELALAFFSNYHSNLSHLPEDAICTLQLIELDSTSGIGVLSVTSKVSLPDSNGWGVRLSIYKAIIKNGATFTQDVSDVDVFVIE